MESILFRPHSTATDCIAANQEQTIEQQQQQQQHNV